jgi:hypothetical protein
MPLSPCLKSKRDDQPVKNAILNGAPVFDSVMEQKLKSLEVRDAEIGLIAQKSPTAPDRGGIQGKIPA